MVRGGERGAIAAAVGLRKREICFNDTRFKREGWHRAQDREGARDGHMMREFITRGRGSDHQRVEEETHPGGTERERRGE